MVFKTDELNKLDLPNERALNMCQKISHLNLNTLIIDKKAVSPGWIYYKMMGWEMGNKLYHKLFIFMPGVRIPRLGSHMPLERLKKKLNQKTFKFEIGK